jgi:hypothetical protein
VSTAVLTAAAFAAGALVATLAVRWTEDHRTGARLSELRAEYETDKVRNYLRGIEAGRVEWSEVERARSLHPTTHPLGQAARVVRRFDREAGK